MRLKQYITELTSVQIRYLPVYGLSTDEVNQTCKQLRDDLERDCDIYKSRAKGSLICRGVSGANIISKIRYQKKTMHQGDRKPKDTPIDVQKLVDKLFKYEWGWSPRAEGLFVTGDKFTANGYGKTHYVVPIGDFKFLWSHEVMDFYTIFISRPDDMEDVTDALEYAEYFGEEYLDTYKDTDLPAAIKSGSEIMLKCKEYYLIGSSLGDTVFDWLKNKPFVLPYTE